MFFFKPIFLENWFTGYSVCCYLFWYLWIRWGNRLRIKRLVNITEVVLQLISIECRCLQFHSCSNTLNKCCWCLSPVRDLRIGNCVTCSPYFRKPPDLWEKLCYSENSVWNVPFPCRGWQSMSRGSGRKEGRTWDN